MHSIVAQWLVSKDKFSFDNKNDVISFYCSHFSSLNKKHIFEVVEKLYVFFQKSHLKALDSKCIYVEKEIYFQGSVLIPDLFYIKDTHLFIIDFKSNQPKSDMELEKQKDMYKEQLDKYQLAITSKIKNITKVTSILIFPLAIKEISWEENS
jgi:ATP-dependent exoDNAse (exonuclease V) beta subunit